MSRYRFELATPADDADLRRILAETPMPGRIAVSFRREPSYFDAAVVDGTFRQVVTARDCEAGRLVGFGSRTVQERYVNGRPEPVGYLSSLRLLPAHRNRGLVARGYAYFRRLHADGRTGLYLTTIAEGNALALDLLTSGRAGLPKYHFAGRYHTVALPPGGRGRKNGSASVTIRSAERADLPAILSFLEQEGPRRQFFPCYQGEDFFTSGGAFRGLRPGDLLLACRNGELVGTLAVWDQHDFRQTVVHSYGSPLHWVRPLYNCWARLRGLPRLPAPGEPFRYRTAALPVVAGDDGEVFRALVERATAGSTPLLIGLHEDDPLLDELRRYRATWYTTRLYLVCWDDGEELRAKLDGRVPYLELGSL
jgi:hypothetical protein